MLFSFDIFVNCSWFSSVIGFYIHSIVVGKDTWYEFSLLKFGASPVAQIVKNLPAMQETQIWSLGQEDSLEKGMATHSSILAWRLVLWLDIRSLLENVSCAFEKDCIWVLLDGMFYMHLLGAFGLKCSSNSVFPCQFSVWMICPLLRVW